MKKTITQEVNVCDKCGAASWHTCLRCGTEMCYECAKTQGIEYSFAIYFRGSGDGFYCKPCDNALTASGEDKRHNAYATIRSLRLELESWETGFKRRKDAAEAALQQLL